MWQTCIVLRTYYTKCTFATLKFSIHLHISEKSSTFVSRKWVQQNGPLSKQIIRQICIAFLVVFLAGCSARKAPTLYGVSTEGTPFDLMERLVYDAHGPSDF